MRIFKRTFNWKNILVPVVDVLNGASGPRNYIHSLGGGGGNGRRPCPTFHSTSFRETTHGRLQGPSSLASQSPPGPTRPPLLLCPVLWVKVTMPAVDRLVVSKIVPAIEKFIRRPCPTFHSTSFRETTHGRLRGASSLASQSPPGPTRPPLLLCPVLCSL